MKVEVKTNLLELTISLASLYYAIVMFNTIYELFLIGVMTNVAIFLIVYLFLFKEVTQKRMSKIKEVAGRKKAVEMVMTGMVLYFLSSYLTIVISMFEIRRALKK